MSFIAGIVIAFCATRPDILPCSQTGQDKVFCAACPGFTVCTCVNGACPSSDIICNASPNLAYGPYELETYSASPCYWSRTCQVHNPNFACGIDNPCDKGDTIGLNGSIEQYRIVQVNCAAP